MESGRKQQAGIRRRECFCRRVRFVVLGVVGTLCLVIPKAATAKGPHLSFITVLVHNSRPAPLNTLARAEREAGDVLATAGVEVVWLDCQVGSSPSDSAGPCKKSPGGDVVELRILAGHPQNRFLETISGVAVAPALAGVYYDDIPHLQLDEDSESNRAIVLGCVIAHEIGHLLLGSRSHSAGGIMQTQWGTEQLQLALMGKLLFSFKESKLMQAGARARIDQERIALTSARSSP